MLAIVGESGSGKSTFAKVLAGLDTATDGSLVVLGQEVADRPVRRRAAKLVAAVQMVFQQPDGTLNPSHPVGWPLARSLRKFGIARDRRTVEAKVTALLEMVRLPASLRHALPRQLSGGQKQRIAIARAFAGNPRTADRRRAGLGARRVGAGGGDQPAAAHPAGKPHHAGVHQPRSRRWCATSPTRWW